MALLLPVLQSLQVEARSRSFEATSDVLRASDERLLEFWTVRRRLRSSVSRVSLSLSP